MVRLRLLLGDTQACQSFPPSPLITLDLRNRLIVDRGHADGRTGADLRRRRIERHQRVGRRMETLRQLFAMRGVLNPDQAEMFDKSVVKALTADAR